ncbi:MAG: response regulator transcription factor [Verrucomicrobiales bacterium]|nr:response regulator transcription factor [Verrucomicrobiales bacterium]
MKTVLVIEDEPEMRRNLARLLKLEGYDAVAAENGAAGVVLARQRKPDLVICDVMMPQMDGHEVLRTLRADPALRSVPFIFLTAKGEKSDQRGGMNLGADDYLTKPVDNDDLIAAVAARLQRAQESVRTGFAPDFSSSQPIESLGLSPREAEVLLWVAQGKTNPEIATILGISEETVKKHMKQILATLGVETRTAASLRAMEVLQKPG